jgi:hypothetical protein
LLKISCAWEGPPAYEFIQELITKQRHIHE